MPEQSVLPAEAYVEEAVYKRESRRLFGRHWICVGILDDVPEPGDAVPLDCGGRSLILTRAEDGTPRVFHNYCRHRGMRLVKTPASGLRRLVCPYHAWAYRLDGALVSTPHIGGPGCHDAAAAGAELPDGLAPVRTAFWHRLIFVDLSGEAEPFEDFIAPLAERWSAYDFTQLRHGGGTRYAVAGNWKLAVENFVDVYHLPMVHPGLNSYNAMNDHHYVRERNFFGQGNRRYAPDDAAVGKMPLFPDLNEEQRGLQEAFCLFPNLLLTLHNDHLRMILIEPDGPGRCRERVEIFVVGEAGTDPELAPYRQLLVERFDAFNKEDLEIVEELQRSMAASDFQAPTASPFFDSGVLHFQRRVAEALSG